MQCGRTITSFDFSRGDYTSLNHFLSISDFSVCYESNNIEHVWTYISNLIKDGIRQFIPNTRKNCDQNEPKWFNSSIRHNKNCVRTLRRKYNKHPTKQNETKLANLENSLQAIINQVKTDYESNLISNFPITVLRFTSTFVV